MSMYFVSDMYRDSHSNAILLYSPLVLTCYIHDQTLHIWCLMVWIYIDTHTHIIKFYIFYVFFSRLVHKSVPGSILILVLVLITLLMMMNHEIHLLFF
jgi:hypothetical protein